MKVRFVVSTADARRARKFFEQHEASPFMQRRRRRNVDGERPMADDAAFWRALATCLLTTQQRSGPDSAVARFGRSDPYPLPLETCRAKPSVAAFAKRTLTKFGGIRRADTIGAQLEANLRWLDQGGWAKVRPRLAVLGAAHAPMVEREAAASLASSLAGLGPKQSRNLLQSLGLTQHEVPIDSRLTKWLKEFGFPWPLSSTALADPGYFDVVSDGFQELCRAAGVLPCLMDAAIFASFDRPWDEAETLW